MDLFISLYDQYYYVLGIVLLLVQVALIVQVASLRGRLSKLKATYEKIFKDSEGQSFERLIEAHADKVAGNARQIAELQRGLGLVGDGLRSAVQHVGFVRFNPFDDTGSDQSFSVAFLDDLDSGVVLTSLHSRTSTRVYAKPIQKGQPLYPLSNEEKEAVETARKSQDKRLNKS